MVFCISSSTAAFRMCFMFDSGIRPQRRSIFSLCGECVVSLVSTSCLTISICVFVLTWLTHRLHGLCLEGHNSAPHTSPPVSLSTRFPCLHPTAHLCTRHLELCAVTLERTADANIINFKCLFFSGFTFISSVIREVGPKIIS